MDKKLVVIVIEGGQARIAECPSDVSVQIKDYDIQGMNEDELSIDEDGNFFWEP